jgi:hypothetical protein
MDKADGKLTELTRSMTDGETLWATLDGDWVYVQRNDRFAEGSTQIQRIPAHGGAAQNVLHMTSAICGFVPHGDHISYDCNTKGGHVAWTAAAGGDALHDFSTVPLQSMVWNGDAFYGFTRDEVHAGGDVVRLALDGSSKVLAHAGDWDDPPVPIGVDDDNVYFRTWGHAAGTVPEEPSRIYRLAKSGGDPVLLATRPYNGIREAHLDCSAITFYGDDADALHRMPKGGGDVDTLVPRNVFGFAVDAHDLVWVERTTAGKTSVHRRSKS